MQKITEVAVTLENGNVVRYRGEGTVTEHMTLVKGDRARDDRPVAWVGVNMNLPITAES
jgi:hypothetical protein